MAVGDLLEQNVTTRAALQPHAVSSPASDSRRLVVVSNRMMSGEQAKPDSGGLAVAIRAALQQNGGIWFGWSGTVREQPNPIPRVISDGVLTSATIELSRRDFDEYYVGFANRALWPLFHYRTALVEFSRQNLEGYLRVNQRFARALMPMLLPEDVIWVHDYHLIPLGRELRRLDQTQPIGFFLHTPFPVPDVLRVLPNHRELVGMLCSYDLIGFQTAGDLHAFREYLVRHAGAQDLGRGMFRAFGRLVRAQVFPIGIEVGTIAAQARAAEDGRHMRRLRQSLGERALMIGVDRLDYSKGLIARFQSFSHLLEAYPQTRGRIAFLQIATLSRSEVPEYRDIRKSLEAAAGHINGRYAEFDWTPLRYINKSFNHRILMGFLRAGRIALVTPFRDGMNLVAKEYVAAQDPDDPGVLVLSCFAGAAQELEQAVIVNPYDIEGMAEAILQGLNMPLDERKERWSEMMRVLQRNDLAAWRENFVRALTAASATADARRI